MQQIYLLRKQGTSQSLIGFNLLNTTQDHFILISYSVIKQYRFFKAKSSH